MTGRFDTAKLGPTEAAVYRGLRRTGYRVLRGGWPDFLAIDRSDRVIAVEVKAPGDRVRPNQAAMHDVFVRLGIPVHVVREWPGAPIGDIGRCLVARQTLSFLEQEVAVANRRLETAEHRLEGLTLDIAWAEDALGELLEQLEEAE